MFWIPTAFQGKAQNFQAWIKVRTSAAANALDAKLFSRMSAKCLRLDLAWDKASCQSYKFQVIAYNISQFYRLYPGWDKQGIGLYIQFYTIRI